MEKVFLIGNLTRDPELKETPSGVSVCRFSVAVNRGYGDDQTADFFNVTAWRGLAENVAKFCKKGSKVGVSGDLQLRRYEGNDGAERLSVDVVAQEIEFLTPKEKRQDDFYSAPAPRGQAQKKPQLGVFDDDGDLPF